VTVDEILSAQAADTELQQAFEAKSVQFIESLGSLKDNNTVDRTLELLKASEALAEEAAALGGKAQKLAIETIDRLETALRKMLNDAVPDGADQLAQAEALSIIMRIPYLAQTSSPLKPIPDEETTAALLSENAGIISMVSQMRSNLSPDFKPNDKDVKDALDVAVADGFSKRRAGKIWAAWSGFGEGAPS
jgi:hypothetical protein